jgi:hypothetical protein
MSCRGRHLCTLRPPGFRIKSYPFPLLYMLFNASTAVLCNDDGVFTNAACSRVAGIERFN